MAYSISSLAYSLGSTRRTGSGWTVVVISWNLMRAKSQLSFYNSFHKTLWYYQRKPTHYLGTNFHYCIGKSLNYLKGQFEVKYAVDQDSKTKKATYNHKLEIKSDHTQAHYGLKLLETLRWPSGYGYHTFGFLQHHLLDPLLHACTTHCYIGYVT